jgi:hypothetical protein
MAVPNDNPPRRTNNIRRVNNTTIGLAIGGAVLVLLLGLSFFYPGPLFYPGLGTSPNPGENTPNTSTETQPQR